MTIPEDEAIPLTLASPGHRITLEVPSSQNLSITLRDVASKHDMDLPSFGTDSEGRNENLHSMTRCVNVSFNRVQTVFAKRFPLHYSAMFT